MMAARLGTPERPAEWRTPRGDTVEEVVTDATGQVIERYGEALRKLGASADEAGTGVSEPVAVHVEVVSNRIVWWARWKSRRGAGYAAADSLPKLRKLLPHGKAVQLVDENDRPVEFVHVTTTGISR